MNGQLLLSSISIGGIINIVNHTTILFNNMPID